MKNSLRESVLSYFHVSSAESLKIILEAMVLETEFRIHKKGILLQRIHCVYLESSLASFFCMPQQTLIYSWHLEPQPSTDSRCDNFLPLRSKKTKDIRGLSPLKQAVVELSVISAFDLPSISSLRSPQALIPYEENKSKSRRTLIPGMMAILRA